MQNKLTIQTKALKVAAIAGVCITGASSTFADELPLPDTAELLEICQNQEDYFFKGPGRGEDAAVAFGSEETEVEPPFKMYKFPPSLCSEILGQANIASFMQNLAANQIGTMPVFVPFLTGNSTGSLDIQTSQGNSDFNIATPDSLPVWARLIGSSTTSDVAESTYLSGAAGAHYAISSDAIVGMMVEFDTQTQENDDTKIDGRGYMFGPYFAAKLPDQPIYVEGSYLFGKADNTISLESEEDDLEFETDRSLATIRVAGDLQHGAYTLTPSLAASRLKSTQSEIDNGVENPTPEQSITTNDVTIGLNVSRSMAAENGTLVLTGGLAGIFSSTEGTGVAEEIATNFEGERGRIHVGTRYTMDNGMILSAATSYDGIGTDDFKSVGFQLQLEMSF